MTFFLEFSFLVREYSNILWYLFTGNDWAIFFGNTTLYKPIAYGELASTADQLQDDKKRDGGERFATAVLDVGSVDGIRRVLLGNSLVVWLQHLLLIDAIHFLSRGRLALSLDRHVQIDIDDIFVGRTGIRMTQDDVTVN